MNIEQESEVRPVLGPAGNKTRSPSLALKPASKQLEKEEEEEEEPSPVQNSRPLGSSLGAPPSAVRRQELLLRSNLSLNASCSSDASTDSFCSRASTGKFARPRSDRRRQRVLRPEKIIPDGEVKAPPELSQGKRRCGWVTPNAGSGYRVCLLCHPQSGSLKLVPALPFESHFMPLKVPSDAVICLPDSRYVLFHDEEWGVPVHDDRRLFELLVLSGALAELTWPAILSKRHIFREVFLDFDLVAVSKLNEKKIIASGSTARSLLSEPKLLAIIENAHKILKITEEFGSFDNYCWGYVNHRPIASRFRYPRQVPVKTPKADVISKDLIKRGFRSVGPTVIYTFMQAAGLTNDHLITCYRFDECTKNSNCNKDEKKRDENVKEIVLEELDLELAMAVGGLGLSSQQLGKKMKCV